MQPAALQRGEKCQAYLAALRLLGVPQPQRRRHMFDPFERQTLKPVSTLVGFNGCETETGCFQAMGLSAAFGLYSPPPPQRRVAGARDQAPLVQPHHRRHVVALQVAFERQTLKPDFSLDNL
jgi:hypothetical protein